MQHDIELGRQFRAQAVARLDQEHPSAGGSQRDGAESGRLGGRGTDSGRYFDHIEGVAGGQQYREWRACPPIIDISRFA